MTEFINDNIFYAAFRRFNQFRILNDFTFIKLDFKVILDIILRKLQEIEFSLLFIKFFSKNKILYCNYPEELIVLYCKQYCSWKTCFQDSFHFEFIRFPCPHSFYLNHWIPGNRYWIYHAAVIVSSSILWEIWL